MDFLITMSANMSAVPTAFLAEPVNLSTDASEHWPVASLSALVFVTAFFVQVVSRKGASISSIPTAGHGTVAQRFQQFREGTGWELYKDGYQRFKDRAYRVALGRNQERISVPAKFLPQLNKLPQDILSFHEAAREYTHMKYTMVESQKTVYPDSLIKASFNPAVLARFTTPLHDEVIDNMRQRLPQTNEWAEVRVHEHILRIVTIASGLLFVGPDLCRNQDYISSAIRFNPEFSMASIAVNNLPSFLRPLFARQLEEVKQVHKRVNTAIEFIQPAVAARRQAAAEKGIDYQKPDDMLQWMIDACEKHGEVDNAELARDLLTVTFSATNSTSQVTTNAIYNLAARPEIISMLREEAKEVLDKSGGRFTSHSLRDLRKMDSFLKEVTRYQPFSAATFQRKAMKDFSLPNGQVIPAGSIIEVPWGCIAADPEIFSEPETFDPLRFYTGPDGAAAGLDPDAATANQFIASAPKSLTFGYGKNVCPGRYFAANQIKMILSTLLLEYDFCMPDGAVGQHEQLKGGGQQIPDPRKTIMVRRQ